MAAKFPTFEQKKTPPKDFATLYYELQKADKFDEHPRSYQSDAGREFEKLRKKCSDIALCLPTGTGKTAVGLLIGRFRQLHEPTRVLYLTPNKQLASQVLSEAQDLDVPTADLRSSWSKIAQAEKNRYTAGDSIGVASFWTLFNSRPRPEAPNLLILDDVHAAGDAALGRWQLDIRRNQTPDLYEEIARILRTVVSPTLKARLGPDPPPEAHVPMMVPQREWLLALDSIESVLDRFVAITDRDAPGGKIQYPYSVVKHKLARLFCFLGPGRIVIRPWLPPSMEIPQFRKASTRLYLSATIDRWGQMQQVVGVEKINRIDELTAPIQGQRLVIDLGVLAASLDLPGQVALVATSVPKILVLSRSWDQRNKIVEELEARGYQHDILGTDPEEEVELFRDAPAGAFVLAGRYDGLDLGHGACQHIMIAGLPDAIGDKELFVTEALEVLTLNAARSRQRIQQAMGRCTREKDDTSVVWLAGQTLSEFLHRAEVAGAFPPLLRLELLAADQVETLDDARELAQECVNRTTEWQKYYKENLEAAAKAQPEEAQIDGEILHLQELDSRFNQKLYDGMFQDALAIAKEIAGRLDKKGYKKEAAVWLYMASAAVDIEQYEAIADPFSEEGSKLLEDAIRDSAGRTWMELLEPYRTQPSVTASGQRQAENVLAFMRKRKNAVRDLLDQALVSIRANEDSEVRKGLQLLGESLGFQVESRQLKGSPDSVWHSEKQVQWIWEAKTDKKADGALSLDDARQMAGQSAWVGEHYELRVSEGQRVTCLTHVTAIGSDGRQERNAFDLVSPDALVERVGPWFDLLGRLDGRLSNDDEKAMQVLAARSRIHEMTWDKIHKTFGVKSGGELLKVVQL